MPLRPLLGRKPEGDPNGLGRSGPYVYPEFRQEGTVEQEEPNRRMTTDQKRARVVLIVIVAVIVLVALGVGWLALSIGIPFWIAAILTITIAGVVGLFMFLNMV